MEPNFYRIFFLITLARGQAKELIYEWHKEAILARPFCFSLNLPFFPCEVYD